MFILTEKFENKYAYFVIWFSGKVFQSMLHVFSEKLLKTCDILPLMSKCSRQIIWLMLRQSVWKHVVKYTTGGKYLVWWQSTQYFTGVDGNVYHMCHVCSFYCKEYLSMFLSMTQSVRTFYKLPQRCYQYQLLQRCMRMCDLMHLHQASYAALKCPRHAVFFGRW